MAEWERHVAEIGVISGMVFSCLSARRDGRRAALAPTPWLSDPNDRLVARKKETMDFESQL